MGGGLVVSRPNDRTKVLYVLGLQRGGTTILSRAIGVMEGFEFAGELRRLWVQGLQQGRVCGCGKPHAECEIWSRVLDADLRFGGLTASNIADLQRYVVPTSHSWRHTLKLIRATNPLDAPAREYAQIVSDLYRSFAEAASAQIVVDSSKHPGDPALLARAGDAKLYCLHVVRDPRGSVFSKHKRNARGGVSQAHILSTIYGTGAWLTRHLTSDAVQRRYGESRSMLVRFEDFVREPAATLRAIRDLVGSTAQVPEFRPGETLRLATSHPPAGNGNFASTEVVIRSEEEWRSALNPIDRIAATAVALPALSKYGYSVMNGPV